MPRVSILMSAYNREAYVAHAIRSITAQTFNDFELLIRDDGSGDRTLEVAKQAAANDPRVQISSGKNLGQIGALNQLAQRATGQFICWVDSDDLLATAALAETVALLDAKPEVGMVYTNYMSINEAGNPRGPGKRCQIPYSKDRLLIDFMTFHFRLVRRSIWDQLGGLDPQAEVAEDYDFCLRLSEVTEIHHLERSLYYYRVHDDTVSREKRVEQIYASQRAIERALKRRNMDTDYELRVEIIGRFQLRKKR
ncbi:MAG TPA: glycosyltransferase [Tepidisphaeraceae bacterium]|nr:glycosyltransferase [Tepidisphaeraceae bacterium]